jgi:hypothetical protein
MKCGNESFALTRNNVYHVIYLNRRIRCMSSLAAARGLRHNPVVGLRMFNDTWQYQIALGQIAIRMVGDHLEVASCC